MRPPRGLPLVWGATDEEYDRPYPADTAVEVASVAMTRAIDVAAPVETTWRWLCQIAVAPYSYDWIDNFGRQSPRELTPGADELELGQVMAKVLVLTSFDPPHQWTGLTTPRGQKLFGAVAMTYAAERATTQHGVEHSRIVCRLAAAAPTRLTRLRAEALAWGDVVMVRKQLTVLKRLAEGT